MKRIPELVVMLTHNDQTVPDAVEVFEAAKNSKAKFWGFKEIGLPEEKMKILVDKMKAAGKTTFLEVVDYTEEGCVEGAKIGARCGFDILMGTLYFDSVKKVAEEAGMKYMPFVGEITGRPSVLGGTIEGMIEDVLTRTPTTDYVAVRLLNREQVLNARAKLEELFPNLLAIEKVNFLRETSTGGGLKRAEGASVLDQFKDFFEYQTGDRLDSDQEAALIDCLRSMREEEER